MNEKGLNCSFTRQNTNQNKKYFDLNANNPFLIAAYGSIDEKTGSKFKK